MESYKQEVDIEELAKWTYQVQKADIVIEQGHGMHELERMADGLECHNVSADGCYKVAQNAILGTKVDYFGPSCALVHPDAELVHDIVKSMKGIEIALIIQHGRLGDRPDWMPGAVPKLLPRRRPDGRPMMVYDNNRNPIACKLDNILDIASIEFAHTMYITWWNALAKLADKLQEYSDMLKSYRVTRPAAPYMPWKEKLTERQNG